MYAEKFIKLSSFHKSEVFECVDFIGCGYKTIAYYLSVMVIHYCMCEQCEIILYFFIS